MVKFDLARPTFMDDEPTTEDVLAGIEARIGRFSKLGRYLYNEGSEEARELLAVVNDRIVELDKAWIYLIEHSPGIPDPRREASFQSTFGTGGAATHHHDRRPGLDELEEYIFRSRFLSGRRR